MSFFSKNKAAALLGLLAALWINAPIALAAPAKNTDAWLSGYVAAVLSREFNMADTPFEIKNGEVTVYLSNTPELEKQKLVSVLSRIQGVSSVQTLALAEPKPPVKAQTTMPAAAEKSEDAGDIVTQVLPPDRLFDPLLADPRWPHFSAAYQSYMGDDELNDVAAVSFGEMFSFLRGDGPLGGEWETGLQAGVFAIFDMDSQSHDLVNADYWVGLPLAWRRDKTSALFRVYHQSSHLGDEFLLRNRVDRINLSYEGLDLKLSYDLPLGFRVYGGPGWLFHKEPDSLDPWSGQAGLEFISSAEWLDGALRPLAGVDVQSYQEYNWNNSVSLRAGVQFENPDLVAAQKLRILLEYYNGHSPNGQFYDRVIEYWGIGAHMAF